MHETAHILQLIRDIGYRVSVFNNPGSLYGTMPAHVEMHAVNDSTDPPDFHMVRVFTDIQTDAEYAAACALAVGVGIDLEE